MATGLVYLLQKHTKARNVVSELIKVPVMVTDFEWWQSSSVICIKVPLKGIPPSQADIFTCDCYIKAHYQPFLFEVFLLHDINSDKSKCYLHKEYLHFELAKTNETEWQSLEKKLTKQEKIRAKQEILQKCQEQAKSKIEDNIKIKTELQQYTVRQAMEIDTKQNALINSRRNAERNRAMNELEEWRETHSSINKESAGCKVVELTEVPPERPKSESSVQKKQTVKTAMRSEYVDKKREEFAKRELPPVRGTGKVKVNFSERAFPTPSRESTAEEETIWLRKMTEARKATGFVSEDLRPEERDPQWCKEKGDSFYLAGNYLGAISAYTHAITLAAGWPSLHANRAAAHYALRNFNKCMMDCSTALELMKPACEGNRASRAKCLARRAASLARLGMLGKAIEEMKAAAKLQPQDEKIMQDIDEMERAWEQNPDSD